ncbi:MAG: alanine racemase [Brevinematia bacterium]
MYLSKSHRPTWAEINIDAIRHNFKLLTSRCSPDVQVIGVVKADAYGHGALQISQEFTRLGMAYLGVSNLDEGIELRTNGITIPIIVLGPVETNEFSKLMEFNIYPTIVSYKYAKELAENYRYRGIFPKVHVEIDTGMGRLGIPYESALLEIEQISNITGMIIDGVFTHFPSADADLEFSNEQLNKFKSLIEETKRLDIKIRHYHIANSAAIFTLPETAKPPFTLVRPGLSLYGYSTLKNTGLINSMTLKTKIIEIRTMKKDETVSYLRTYRIKKEKEYIAVLPIGYADGIPTTYSNRGYVTIKGKKYNSVGRVCMDYTMVSLGETPGDIEIGDEVTIFGNGAMSIEEFGKICSMIPYEVTCNVSKRVPRIYIRKEDRG